ncbi:MAG TPA: SagB/ThcOx family dehydrogenase [Deltaproteobacteria bacterium]|nr:SagB/ThcOx family dehydrogenase [Deltaproteobacteria bacterium]HQI01100.1 SagB/ThcOx family dehydrogenase [Deltaproteobacteria bacterium]HQJ09337.1 SagB/ThcOx family dehydrogenase [Deltaproteobacteria bacterium]
MLKGMLITSVLLFFSLSVSAEELKPIKLPPPQLDSGKTLMSALKERKSSREFSTRKLPVSVLSNLLWSACGVNRPESGKRTSPSAMNRQEIDVYVAASDGLYLYDAKGHALKPILKQDLRALTGMQPFAAEAPINLVCVADLEKTGGASTEERIMYASADTGFISENVYLSCAAQGLATVVRGSVDRDSLAKAMKLGPTRKIILAQTVGYPKE